MTIFWIGTGTQSEGSQPNQALHLTGDILRGSTFIF
jgi:hypothetical protein